MNLTETELDLYKKIENQLRLNYHLIPRRNNYESKLLEPYMILDIVLCEIAKFYGIDPESLRSKKREGFLPQARQTFFYIVSIIAKGRISLNYMATYINRDHATAIYGRRRIKDLIQFEVETRNEVETILENVKKELAQRNADINETNH